MARPSNSHLASRLRQLILSSPTQTALFYARLYHAVFPITSADDHEPLHLLALCLIAAEEPYSAIHLVRDHAEGTAELAGNGEAGWPMDSWKRRAGGGCGGCAVILARCCEKLGRYSEGATVLARAMKRGLPTLTIPSPASTSASSHLLLAKLSHKGKSPEQAVENYQKALTEDPWMWEAFTGLCEIGSPPNLELLFPDPPSLRSSISRSSRPPTLSPNPMPRSSASEMPGFLPPRKLPSPRTNGVGATGGEGFFTPDVNNLVPSSRMGMLGAQSWDTPSGIADTTFPTIGEESLPAPSRRPFPNLISSFMPSLPAALRSNNSHSSAPMVTPVVEGNGALNKPPTMKRSRGGHGIRRTLETPQNGLPMRPNGRDLKSIEPNGESDAPVRRSSRLKTTNVPIVKAPRKDRSTRSNSQTSSASGATVDILSPPSQDSQLQSAADDWLRDIVRRCAKAYRALSMYACQDALREIDTLPVAIQTSVWAIDIVARSFYEMANYVPARRAFAQLFTLEPYRLESTDHYSTLLWHLSDSAALSHLSQNLMAVNREATQTWIAAGNCFSLQKDHDEAMRCFKRATQIDPGCAYAWTLCGYEAVEMEEFERAIGYYRTAIKTDSRHYNAWYGMGLVYMKTGKIPYAEHHFRRAAEINPTNAVLLSCIGMVLEQSDETVQALAFYDQACKYAPDSPMVQFKRIRVLVALQHLDAAIAALKPLSKQTPDEANIFFLLGKCYLRQGQRGEATVAFTSARELQPKLEGAIKATIERDGEDEDDEEDDEGGEEI